MTYVGTCVVCGEPIGHATDLAWVAPLSLGGPRRRAHAGTCSDRAAVQAGPEIEGARPPARSYDERFAWIVARSRRSDDGLTVLADELEAWLAELKASPPREEEGGR